MPTNPRRYHTKIFQAPQAHQSHCILQEIYQQLQTFQGQQANDHSVHTRSWPGADLLCEDGPRNFLCPRNEELHGGTRGRSHQFSQDTASIHQARHQMILPPNHHFTRLVVSAEHTRLHHAGPQLLTASLRERFWMPRIRNLVKTVIHQCLTCYKFKVQASQQLTGELPSSWVQPAWPFTTTGIDYAGPIVLRLGSTRSKQTTKGYIAIFVCFVTKAVHIEVVTSLTTEAFLAALRRFIARQGRPKVIYSDDGTNFQGASNQLQEVYNMLQCPTQMMRVHDFLTTEGCDRKFIPTHGPHFGGLWEAAVKSMKYHMWRTLGAQIATYEELGTLLVEIEACLNSRPLCALPNDPHTSYLSPGHFLIGEPLTQLPTIDFTNIKMSRLSRWQTFQQQLQKFWKRWSADYLHELQHRQRWHRSSPTYNLEILWSWGKTTRLHFTGLQRSSLMSTQELTAEHKWSQSRPLRGHLNVQLQKFAPYRM